jgi:hypothetical protein
LGDLNAIKALFRAFLLTGIAVAAGAGFHAGEGGATGASLTFAGQVAPILNAQCVTCHRGDGVAPSIPLVTYEDARRFGARIKQQVRSRLMPPWPADDKHSMPFRNDPKLTQQDIDTLSAWVDRGMIRGQDAAPQPLSATQKGWLHPQGRAPDAVVALPTYTVKPNGEVPYIQVRVKVPFQGDRWISAIQVRPSNLALVHHLGITEVSGGNGMTPEKMAEVAEAARRMGLAPDAFVATAPVVSDPENPKAYDMLGIYTPGTTFESYGEGNDKLLRGGPNNYLNFNVHYTATGREETDRTELALWFDPNPPKHQLLRVPAAGKTILANGHELLTDDQGTKAEGTDFAIPPIPPNTESYALVGVTAFSKPVVLYQFQPHAHLRAKDFTYTVVYPDGREQTVLSVPKYDFHWQLAYELATPLELPAGSKLVVSAHYDNSAKNAELVKMSARDTTGNCGPDKQTYFKRLNQSWDEMFSPMIQYAVANEKPGSGSTRSAAGRPGGGGSAPIVEAVGCLSEKSSGKWFLTRASTASDSASQATSRQELNAMAGRALGDRTYDLIGVGPFGPAGHTGHVVAVKGALIGSNGNGRVNVTSLETLRDVCK